LVWGNGLDYWNLEQRWRVKENRAKESSDQKKLLLRKGWGKKERVLLDRGPSGGRSEGNQRTFRWASHKNAKMKGVKLKWTQWKCITTRRNSSKKRRKLVERWGHYQGAMSNTKNTDSRD